MKTTSKLKRTLKWENTVNLKNEDYLKNVENIKMEMIFKKLFHERGLHLLEFTELEYCALGHFPQSN